MATVTLTPFQLPGALGPILVDVRTSSPSAVQPAIIIHHGFKGFKDFALLPVFAERMARSGFTAVTLSVSGAGVDRNGEFTLLDRFAENTYSRELDDLGVVVRALQRGELGVPAPSSTGMVGHSRGGGMTLCLAREFPAIKAVATWASIGRARRHDDAALRTWQRLGTIEIPHARLRINLPLNYVIAEDCLRHEAGRLNIPEAAATLSRPWLLVHGTEDETVPLAEARDLLQQSSDPRTESLFLEGAGHTFGATHPWAGPTRHTERLFDATARFFIRHLE